jgi:hypothetical protein
MRFVIGLFVAAYIFIYILFPEPFPRFNDSIYEYRRIDTGVLLYFKDRQDTTVIGYNVIYATEKGFTDTTRVWLDQSQNK